MLFLKAIPLIFPLIGVLREKRYTYQWTSMLILAYFAEGCVRAISDTGMSRQLAVIEIALSSALFCLALIFSRRTRPLREPAPKSAD